MTEYSERAKELAKRLGEKAANKLRARGFIVEYDKNGRLVIVKRGE